MKAKVKCKSCEKEYNEIPIICSCGNVWFEIIKQKITTAKDADVYQDDGGDE